MRSIVISLWFASVAANALYARRTYMLVGTWVIQRGEHWPIVTLGRSKQCLIQMIGCSVFDCQKTFKLSKGDIVAGYACAEKVCLKMEGCKITSQYRKLVELEVWMNKELTSASRITAARGRRLLHRDLWRESRAKCVHCPYVRTIKRPLKQNARSARDFRDYDPVLSQNKISQRRTRPWSGTEPIRARLYK